MGLGRLVNRRRLLAPLAAVGLVLIFSGSVFAHDCYNASTSVQGNLSKAAHSPNWYMALDVEQLITTGNSGFFTDMPVLDSCQQQAFLASYEATGLPLTYVTAAQHIATGQGGVIAGNNPQMGNGLGSNGTGIDHFDDAAPQILAALQDAYNAAFSASCS